MRILVIFAIVAAVAFLAFAFLEEARRRRAQPEPAPRGVWKVYDLTINEATHVVLIRVDGNTETGRQVVATIPRSIPDWSGAYLEAHAEAERRLSAIQAATPADT